MNLKLCKRLRKEAKGTETKYDEGYAPVIIKGGRLEPGKPATLLKTCKRADYKRLKRENRN